MAGWLDGRKAHQPCLSGYNIPYTNTGKPGKVNLWCPEYGGMDKKKK